MAPIIALHRRQPKQLRRNAVHADFRIQQHMRPVSENDLAPPVEAMLRACALERLAAPCRPSGDMSRPQYRE